MDTCDRAIHGRGLCSLHYRHARAGKLPIKIPPARKATDDWGRFVRYVEPTGFCWLWTGATGSNGYGQVRVNGTLVPAHQWVYETLVGPVSNGLELDHLCRIPLCVCPDHLDPVTHSRNILIGNGKFERRTHCRRGHDLREPGVIKQWSGRRQCRICLNDSVRRKRAQRADLA